jgi:carbon storage regulator
MLAISRRKNEGLVINDNITVTVIEIRGDKVRLGIVAPREATVHRQEVYEALHGRSVWDPVPPPPVPAAPPPPPAPPIAPAPPSVELTPRQADCLDKLAAALAAKLGVPVSRDALAQAILDAGLKELVDAVAT